MDFVYASLQRKAKIYNILAVTALGLFLLFLGYALYEVRVNGPLYEHIRRQHDLLAYVMPLILFGVLACGALLGSIWCWSFQRWWVQPLLRRMADVQAALMRIGEGDYATPVAEGPPDEFAQIMAAIESMRSHLYVAVRELEGQRMAAQAGERAKSEFLTNMSHEIRTPMNAILGLMDLALRSDLSDRQQAWLTKADEAARALLELLDQILELSDTDATASRLEIMPFTLQTLLDRVTAAVGEQALQKGLVWCMEAEPGTPSRFRGDAHRIEQVLVNLCKNAVKFTEKGEVVTTVSVQEQDQDQCVLRLTVRDTGVGMTHAQTEYLFKPFAQCDASLTRRHGGSGLGLVICKKWVDAMGGVLSVSSAFGKGSEFSFTVPLYVVPEEMDQPMPLTPIQGGASFNLSEWAALNGKRVLLVEDNDINQLVASELLRDVAGMEVMAADGGLEALVLLQNHVFDVVLMDIQMPGLDGFETTRRLRAMGLSADRLPVIAMTAHTAEHDRAQCIAAGMNDFISKPVMPAKMFSMIQTWIQACAKKKAPHV